LRPVVVVTCELGQVGRLLRIDPVIIPVLDMG